MTPLLWLKFYPKDWNGDHSLRACSLATRGLLASFLEPMHESEPYGHLLIRGKKPDYVELAIIASCKLRQVKYGIEELVRLGVLSVNDDGILFSRRMVRDAERHEKRSENGRKGGNPKLASSEPTQQNQHVNGTSLNLPLNHIDIPIESRGQRPEARGQKQEQKTSSALLAEPTSPTVLTFSTQGPVAEWALTEAHIANWQGLFPALDVLGECRKALAWCEANTAKRKTARGMPAFLVRWLTSAVDRGPSSNGRMLVPAPSQGRTAMLADATREFLKS